MIARFRWLPDARPRFRWVPPIGRAPALDRPATPPATAAIVGPTGAPGKSFDHVQASPSAEWVVNHNLGSRPSASVMTPGGVVVQAEVIHASTNQLRVYFAQPQVGSVHCV